MADPQTSEAAETPPGQAARVALAVVAVVAIAWFLRAGASALLPIGAALFLVGILAPVHKGLRLVLPDWLSATVIVTALAALAGLALWKLGQPMVDWLERLPDLVRRLQRELGPLSGVLERMLDISPEEDGNGGDGEGTSASEAGRQLAAMVLQRAQPVMAGLLVVAVLLFFLFAEGAKSIDKVSAALAPPRRTVWLRMVRAIGRDVMRYLQVMVLMTTLLGLSTWAALWAMGMPNAGLWGVIAGIINLIPYLGPALTLVGLVSAAAMTFSDPVMIILPALVYYVLTFVEGQIIMPLAVGRHMGLNPLAVLIAILFWSWAWGILGAFLAVPLTASLRVVLQETGRLPVLRAALA